MFDRPGSRRVGALLVVAMFIGSAARAQQLPDGNDQVVSNHQKAGGVPPVVRFSGLLVDAQGEPREGPLPLTFAIYAEAEGGEPLWSETQTVTPGANGRYQVLLGSAVADGLPQEVFASGDARWLGVQVGDEHEQPPRLMLVSVPYALKAGDATTLGGKPAADFVLGQQLKTPDGREELGIEPRAIEDDIFTATADPGPGFISLATSGPPLAVNSGELVANLNANYLNGFDAAAFAQLSASNTFTADQVVMGNVGVNMSATSAGLGVQGAGAGLAGPALRADNTNPSGIGIWSTSNSADANLVVSNAGPGDLMRAFSSISGDPVFAVRNDGTSIIPLGNIGIGTTTPQARLDVVGRGAATAVRGISLGFLGGGTGGFFSGGVGGKSLVAEGNGIDVLIGDPGCGPRTAAIGFGTMDCATFFLGGDRNNNSTFINRPAGGRIAFRENNGPDQMTIHPGGRVQVNGTATVNVLEITGGSDLSEQFEVAAPFMSPVETSRIEPGMIVSIDPLRPGKLVVGTTAYDRRAAGVISGAGGIKPGMLMGQAGSLADGDHPVALTGRVYVWADASYGTIEPGDLLTTSETPGHAMKVTDHSKAQGAIIGKAMTGLPEGKGLVLLLVTLQ